MTQGRTPPPGPEEIDALLDDIGAMAVPDPSPDLMARVLAEAEAHLPPPGAVPVRGRMPWWRQVLTDIGGWGAVGGLVAATATGFVIGLGALDATGVDALWTLGFAEDYGAEQGLDAFGWALEEG